MTAGRDRHVALVETEGQPPRPLWAKDAAHARQLASEARQQPGVTATALGLFRIYERVEVKR